MPLIHVATTDGDMHPIGAIVGKYFAEDEIDAFMSAWLRAFPDGLERARANLIPGRPFNRSAVAKSMRERSKVANGLDFFRIYRSSNIHAYSDLEYDVVERILKEM